MSHTDAAIFFIFFPFSTNTFQKWFFLWYTLFSSKNLQKLKMSHTDVIEKIRIEKLWFSFKNWFICFFPHELTCMWSYHLLLKFPPIKHTVFFYKTSVCDILRNFECSPYKAWRSGRWPRMFFWKVWQVPWL